mmetsp:Transcript_21094/g.80652  ORF Transcript_21094/g.80652 Transcript_21094/m.80652 type:complete len:235 (-) Transcript_21094:70-774(-)
MRYVRPWNVTSSLTLRSRQSTYSCEPSSRSRFTTRPLRMIGPWGRPLLGVWGSWMARSPVSTKYWMATSRIRFVSRRDSGTASRNQAKNRSTCFSASTAGGRSEPPSATGAAPVAPMPARPPVEATSVMRDRMPPFATAAAAAAASPAAGAAPAPDVASSLTEAPPKPVPARVSRARAVLSKSTASRSPRRLIVSARATRWALGSNASASGSRISPPAWKIWRLGRATGLESAN